MKMPGRTTLLRGLIVPSLLLFSLPLAAADYHLRLRRDADEMSDPQGRVRGGKNQTIDLWIGSDRARRDLGSSSVILRLDTQRLYLLDTSQKTYCEQKVKIEGESAVAESPSSQPREAREAMLEVFGWKVETKETTTPKTVGPWTSKKTEIRLTNAAGRRAAIDWWGAAEITIADRPYRLLVSALQSLEMSGGAWVGELAKLPFSALLEARVAGPDVEFTSREELLALESQEVPKAKWEAPTDFRKLSGDACLELAHPEVW